ncbi:MAG: hypothetical protein ACPGED_04620, partial [Flavobacteriales bacterium]
MSINIYQFSALILFTFAMVSCTKQAQEDSSSSLPSCSSEAHQTKSKVMHPYGGWSCPDNIYGFPAVDLADLSSVPVVQNRLPTREETRNGKSLMYFDLLETPTARAIDIDLPQVARYYSEYTKKNEVVIAIQAVTAENDTVVGFRYLNGGNGSAWFNEVEFMSAKELRELGPTPFVQTTLKINATKERVWEVITGSEFAKELGSVLHPNSYFESAWKSGSKVHFMSGPNRVVSTGKITALWQDSYIQVDYDFAGDHYVEKFLLLDSQDKKGTNLTLVSGPYKFGAEERTNAWNNWLEK